MADLDHPLRTATGIPRIAVVIVTYNSAKVLGECLRSIAAARQVTLSKIVIADNASTDGSLALAKAAPGLSVRSIQIGHNAGYAAAINAAVATLRLASLDAVFVMNPDCRLRPDSLRVLFDALRQQPQRGLAVPRLVNPDGTIQPSLRRTPTVVRALAEAVIGGNLAGRLGTLGEQITDPQVYDRPGNAAWATGAALLVTTRAVQDIGPWDESFFLYSEETEYALRAADRGWDLWYEPAAVVEHLGGESRTNPALSALETVNKVRLFRRRQSQPTASAYFAAVVLGELIRTLTGRRTAWASVQALLWSSRRRMLFPH